MNRRDLIKKATLVGAFGFLSVNKFYGQETAVKEPEWKDDFSGYQKINLNGLEIYILSDGFLRETDVDGFSTVVNPQQVKKVLRDNYRPDSYIDLSMNCILIKLKDRLVLIDSGIGKYADAHSGKLTGSLKKVGFTPDQVTDIFISHAHVDHIGGLIDGQGNLVYANAQHHISRYEFEFWMNAKPLDFNKSGAVRYPNKINANIGFAREILGAIQHKVAYFDYDRPLYDVFSFELVPGHTPGMTFVKIGRADKHLTYIADQAHADIIQIPHPDWGHFADTDLQLAIASRKKVNKTFSTSGELALGYHLPWPGLGHIQSQDKRYRWNPVAVFAPGELIL